MKKKTTKKATKVKKERKKEMPKTPEVAKKVTYKVKNISGVHAKELKPGVGLFEIAPGATIEVDSLEVAKSLVADAGGSLVLEK